CSFFYERRRRHTILVSDWSSDVCSSDLRLLGARRERPGRSAAECREEFAPFHSIASQMKEDYRRNVHGCQPAKETRPEHWLSWRSEERRVGKEGRSGGGEEK